MKNCLRKLIPIALLSASTCAVPGQSAASSAQDYDEIRATSPLKPAGNPKRVVTARIPRNLESRAFAFSGTHPWGADRTSQPLIIQTSKVDAKVASQIHEDMAVMSRLLEKSCSDYAGEPDRILGLDILIHAGGAARNMFIDDYGVIFTMSVDLPLKAAPKGTEVDPPGETEVNAEWENARNELFGSKRPTGSSFLRQDQRRDFNPQDVARLRENLLDGLCNAANIRNLKDENWVTVVVRGRGDAPESESRQGYAPYLAESEEGESIMVLKVRKSDLDAFARKGTAEEFRKRVMVNIY